MPTSNVRRHRSPLYRAATVTGWLLLLLILASTLTPARAAGQWIKLTTSHFELYTTVDESQARTALANFEQVRNFFLQATPFPKALAAPVRIVAFQSEPEYRPYHPSESAPSFYTHDKEHDYIVMETLAPDYFIYAIHEYTHLVIARSGLNIPLWMNEGWADLNSTLKAKGNKAMIGDIIPGRREVLLRSTWIPLADLDKVNQESPLYNEREKASVFYGESWALVHMLFLSSEYRNKFNAFVQATLAGKNISEACVGVFGKSASQVQADLAKYINGGKLQGALYDVKLDLRPTTATVASVDPVDSGLFLADVLTLTHKFAEAKKALENLAQEYPKEPRVQEALGYLSFKADDEAEGIRHLRQAFDLGSTDSTMCYRLAVLLHTTSINRGDAIAMLRRAVELKPDFPEARLQLGVVLMESQDYSGSLQQLRLVSKIPETSALFYFTAAAVDNAKLGRLEEARKAGESARKWARTPAQVSQVDQLLGQIGAK